MESEFEDPPCNIDDVIKLSYSFDNLYKFLNFLLIKDRESFSKLRDVNIKILEIDDIKVYLEEVTNRVHICEGRFSEIDTTIKSFFEKFKELDNKIVTAISVNINFILLFSLKKFFIYKKSKSILI
jgi:hypothetical protein